MVESLTVHLVFFFSGVAALVYQLVWQRSLLMIYGSNAESVAMVVAAFLVGLGLGSLGGGAVSRWKGVSLVRVFAAAELGIGLYGAVSLKLFRLLGSHTDQVGSLQTGWWAFLLVLVPTMLMGATLPLLVAWQVKASGAVGDAVAWLYAVNTLGGALGAFLAAFVVLGSLGLSGAVRWAVVTNLVSAVTILVVARGKGCRG